MSPLFCAVGASEPVLRHGLDGISICKKSLQVGKNSLHTGLSHIIQHDICRDACNHINTAEFIAGVFE